jgi:hypothetical protein
MIAQDFLQRLKDDVSNRYHLHNLSDFIEKHMYLEGRRMSFRNGYQFQKNIVNDTSRVTNISKLAQIGATTSTIAYFLAGMATQPKFNVIYALPTAGDASKLVTTKVDPLIGESPALKRLLDKEVDSVELKRLGQNFLFSRGARSETAALSISADVLVIDELDRADPATVKQFRSRLQASQLQIIKQFSTPTIQGLGITKEAETSKRYRHMAKCGCCGHLWLPSYHTDIIIPGYLNDLKELTAANLKDTAWQQARWNCPECGRDPKLLEASLEWVCENAEDNYEAHTYFISPATACEVLKPSYFVRVSTEFEKRSEFLNQCLGEVAEEENEQLQMADIDAALVQSPLDSSELHVLGADMGQLCHVTIGRMTQDGDLLVVHREAVPLATFEVRRRELCAQYRVIVSVHDTQPETHLVTKITDYDPRAWGAMFSSSKNPELFTTHQKEEDKEEGKLNLRLVKIARTPMLDKLLEMFKRRQVVIHKSDDDAKFAAQMLSLKRSQEFVGEELTYVWKKTNHEDHYHFSLCYLLTAALLRGTAGGWAAAGTVPLVSSFSTRKS